MSAYATSVSDPIARIRAGDQTWLYSLSNVVTVVPLDAPGTCVIEIAEGSVGVVDSECPQQICMSMGRIERRGQWIACLPHRVFIDVVGGADGEATVDASAF